MSYVLIIIHKVGFVMAINFADIVSCQAAEKQFHRATRDNMPYSTFCAATGVK